MQNGFQLGGPTDLYSASQQPQPLPYGQPQQQVPQQITPGLTPDQRALRQQQRQQLEAQRLQQLAALGELEAEDEKSKRDRALAQQLRGDAKGQLKGVDTGKFYVGPTWVNMLASVMQQQAAGRNERGATERDEKTAKAESEASRALQDILTRQYAMRE